MKIRIVFDNNPHHPLLKTGFGFACVIESGFTNILFDTGSDGDILLSNIENIKLKPQDFDIVVLSHNHWDHIGGLHSFLQENDNVDLYLPLSFPDEFKSELTRYNVRVTEVRESRKLCEKIHTTGELNGDIPEQSLICETEKGSVVITGCAHPGIVNIIKQAKELHGQVFVVLGGFHLYNANQSFLQRTAEELMKQGVAKICSCHCTGDNARKVFHDYYGENSYLGGAGSVFIFQ